MVVVPDATPDTRPVLLMVALVVLLLLHTPPAKLLLNCVVLFAQTVLVPVMEPMDGNPLTDTVAFAILTHPPVFGGVV